MAISKKLSVIDTTGRPTVDTTTVKAAAPYWAQHKERGFVLSGRASNGDETYTPTYGAFNTVANPKTGSVGSVQVVGKKGGKMDINIVRKDGVSEPYQKDATTDQVHGFLDNVVAAHQKSISKQ